MPRFKSRAEENAYLKAKWQKQMEEDLRRKNIVYAPYVMQESTPEVVGNFEPKIAASSRYAKSEVNPNYYNTIKVQPLDAPSGMVWYMDCVYDSWQSSPYKYLLLNLR